MARKRYSNSNPAATTSTFKDMLRWQKERKEKRKDLSFRIGQADQKQQALLNSDHQELTITWIGHSTFLIQIDGLTIVTDPVWAKQMGFSRRMEEPGLSLDEIPPVDVVLLSHSHYDHLHVGSLRKLKGSPVVLVPEGLERNIERIMRGCDVQGLPWWGHVSIGSIDFHFVPAQHWTKRTLTDTNTSHWGGWVIEPSAETTESIYFAGDSGYFEGFCEIGKKFTDITYALMPIGAYEPEWFMGTQHVTPEEAIQAFIDVGAKLFIPMHYGAFRLADDTTDEALNRLLAEWKRRELNLSELKLLKHGETIVQTVAVTP